MAVDSIMVRSIIPRASGAKEVQTTDFEKYFCSSWIEDYVICGLVVTAGTGLAVDISTGNARLKGMHLNNSASCCCAVMCLGSATCNHIYAQLSRDCMCRPTNFTFTSNTSGCPPTDAFEIAIATTNACSVTAVACCTTVKWAVIPTGSLQMWAGQRTKVPTGWLLADGASRNKTTCARLFGVIGGQFGCCGATFCLPDLRSKFARGAPACCNPGGTGGSDTVTLTANQSGMPTHQHTYTRPPTTGSANTGGGTVSGPGSAANTGVSSAVGAMCSHQNMPSFLEFLYIIRQ